MNRRDVIGFASAGLAAGTFPTSRAQAVATRERASIKAIAFDAFPIFDPRGVQNRVVQRFPERGAELAGLWRTRQFEYQWLHALAGRYANFWDATEGALINAAATLNIELTAAVRSELMHALLELDVWPDARAALTALQHAGLRLAFLSNATPRILQTGLRTSNLSDAFEYVLSTDAIGTYKPAPPAYQMAVDAFGLPATEILFVASAGWDAAGAKWFGYPTFWVNRQRLPMDELGVLPDGIGEGMMDLAGFVEGRAGSNA